MNKYFKKILIFFFIFYFLFSSLFDANVYAKEDDSDWYKLWEKTEDTFKQEIDDDKDPKHCSKKQKIIDGGIEKKYDYNLIYTDMQECLCVALENNFQIKVNKQNKEMNKWEYRAKLAEFLPNIYATFMIANVTGNFLVGNILPREINEVPIQINYGVLWNFNKGRTIFESRQRNDVFKASGHKLDFTKEQTILNTMLKMNVNDIYLNKTFLYKGEITENYVANQLMFNNVDLYYWAVASSSEIDFIIYNEDGIIPIEVKASDNTQSKSLNEYMKRFKPKYAIRISGKNFGFENGIKSVPLYATFLVK